METILKLRAVGYRVEIDGDLIRYRMAAGTPEPDGATLASILADLKARKEEAVAFLRAEAEDADRPPVDPSDPLPAYPFAVRSRVLDGAEVWIIPDGWTEPVPGPTYTHSEIATLARQGAAPEALQAVHRVKVEFDGEVLR